MKKFLQETDITVDLNEQLRQQDERNKENLANSLLLHGYKYVKPIGKGGFSAVHLVFSQRYQKEFVAKVSKLTEKQKTQIISRNSSKENSLKENSLKENSLKENSLKENSLKENPLQENSLKENSLKESSLKDNLSNMAKSAQFGVAINETTSISYQSQDKVNKIYNNFEKYENPEISSLISLTHPNIIHMYEYFNDDENMYLILEYCPNGSLDEYIKKRGPIRPPAALYSMYYQILSALKYMHDMKIAHLDIKPANILLDDHFRPKLADFGLSDVLRPSLIGNENIEIWNNFHEQRTTIDEGSNSDAKGEFLMKGIKGTKPYMSPEMLFLNGQKFDAFKSDVWSLGITFYVMAEGDLPWVSPSDESSLLFQIKTGEIYFSGDWGKSFHKMVRRMIDYDPGRRATVSELLNMELMLRIVGSCPSTTDASTACPNLISKKSIRLSSSSTKMPNYQFVVDEGPKNNQPKKISASMSSTCWGAIDKSNLQFNTKKSASNMPLFQTSIGGDKSAEKKTVKSESGKTILSLSSCGSVVMIQEVLKFKARKKITTKIACASVLPQIVRPEIQYTKFPNKKITFANKP